MLNFTCKNGSQDYIRWKRYYVLTPGFFSFCQPTGLPEDTEIMYSFWNGIPYRTHVHILKHSASCPTVSTLADFEGDK